VTETKAHRDSGAPSSTKAVDYFESHAEYYARSQYHGGRRTFINSRHDHIVRMLAGLAVPDTATVLDAGCGPGNLVPEFARRFSHVCAMDASPRMVEKQTATEVRCRDPAWTTPRPRGASLLSIQAPSAVVGP
jgi:2-polyprenyl-3-methyl-5-hydroxy-6-metoxy-1,4-benzoquinol methylase